MGQFVRVASSLDRASLERLERFLAHHNVKCHVESAGAPPRFHLCVADTDLSEAEKVLEGLAFADGDAGQAEDIVEVDFQGDERTEVAAWLQILLEEEDHEGSPIYFYKDAYEDLLDSLHGGEGPVQIPYFILRGLRNYLPRGEARARLGGGLREFFDLIETVAGPSGD